MEKDAAGNACQGERQRLHRRWPGNAGAVDRHLGLRGGSAEDEIMFPDELELQRRPGSV